MGGVDLGDQLMQEYHPNLMSVKMWKKMLLSFLVTATDRYLLEKCNCFVCPVMRIMVMG